MHTITHDIYGNRLNTPITLEVHQDASGIRLSITSGEDNTYQGLALNCTGEDTLSLSTEGSELDVQTHFRP